uniref:UspA domain-containing protein n=1 Tax=Opuntia streptacantha TaxID=393608 RepID=A0A7C8Z9Q0_OPUST
MSAVPSTSTSTLVGIDVEKGARPPSPTPTAEQNQFHSNRDEGNTSGSHDDDTGILVAEEFSCFNIVRDIISSNNAAAMDVDMMTTSTYGSHSDGLISEIIEIVNEDGQAVLSEPLRTPDTTASLFSIDINTAKDVVYVAVGETETSMDALLWTLNHTPHPPNALVCLIHVFPPLKFVPGPGKYIPRSPLCKAF